MTKTGREWEQPASLPAKLASVLARFPSPEVRSFVRRTCGEDRPHSGAEEISVLAASLARLPFPSTLAALRVAFPAAVVDWDHLAEEFLPVEARLGRVLPVVPTLRRIVGRDALLAEILGADVVLHGGHLHLCGASGAGTSTLAAQVARLATDFVPVVVWLDGATSEACTAGALAFATQLGFPHVSKKATLDSVGEWLARNRDWMVVVDDAPTILPDWLRSTYGRIVTTGKALRSDAGQQRVIPPWGDSAPAECSAMDGHALSQEAQTLRIFMDCLAPAPLPSWVFSRSLGFSSAAAVTRGFEAVLKSPRVARDAARELVQRGYCRWVGTALRRMSRGRRPCGLADGWVARVFCEALSAVPPGNAVWDVCAHAVALLNDDSVDTPLRFSIAQKIGRWLLSENEAEEALEWFFRATSLGVHGPMQADGCNDLGVTLRRVGRLADAKVAFEQALSVRDCAEHDVAATRFNLGHVCRDLGDLPGAQACYDWVYQVRSGALGAGHADTLAVRLQQGAIWFQLGEIAQSRVILADCVAGLGRVRPLPRRLLASAQRQLALVLAREGEWEGAIRLVEHAVTLLVTEYDDRAHPEVLAARSQLEGLELAVRAHSG